MARYLLESSDLPLAGIAAASGFTAADQLAAALESTLDVSIQDRERFRASHAAGPGELSVMLPYREPMDFSATPAHLWLRALPSMEVAGENSYTRTLSTVIGQQVSARGASTIFERVVREHGRPAFEDEELLLFPGAERFASLDPTVLPIPRARARTLTLAVLFLALCPVVLKMITHSGPNSH